MAAVGLRNPLDFKASSVFETSEKNSESANKIDPLLKTPEHKKIHSIETSLFNEAEYNNTYLIKSFSICK